MKTKVPSLEQLEKYRRELRLQIENVIAGKAITKNLSNAAKSAFTDINNIPTEVKDAVTDALTAKNISDGEVSSVIHDCERALKLRQAVKICSNDGVIHWMWRLQPGEKVIDLYE